MGLKPLYDIGLHSADGQPNFLRDSRAHRGKKTATGE